MGADQPQKNTDEATALRQRLRKAEEQDRKHSSETWSKAEAALSEKLREKAQQAGSEESHSRAQSPLLPGQSSASEDELVEGHATPSGRADSRGIARATALSKRAKMQRFRAAECAEKTVNHGKRRLRVKVANVLMEVRRRQDLHQNQERARHFREQRCAFGRGCGPDLGDATQGALGLSRPVTVDLKEDSCPPTSPRRTAILDSLTLSELDILRRTPEFFFSGPAVTAAVAPAHPVPPRSQSAGMLGSVSSGLTDDASSSTGKSPARALTAPAPDVAGLEDLMEFFSCSRADRSIDVGRYVRNLRAQLAEMAQKAQGLMPLSGSHAKKPIDWRQKLCRTPNLMGSMTDGAPSTAGQKSRPDDSMTMFEPLEMMPCLGRHPHIREDEVSPTLARVREVYNRRDLQDAKWVEDHREAIANRLALNAFKAKEQQRELLLEVFKQKELHKVRMLEAEVRKSMLDTEARDHLDLLRLQKHHRGQRASEAAELSIEERREAARSALDAWQTGARNAQRHLWKEATRRRIDGARKLDKYMTKINAFGETKHNVVTNQTSKNDELKTRIHESLSVQIQQQRVEEAAICAEITDAKLEAAAHRRKQAQLGNRYNFVEKAFGETAVGFDAKHHAVATNRQSPSWKRNAEAWAKQRDTFGIPSISSTGDLGMGASGRPWTPTGTCSEQELIERMETLAVTLA
mmetsp:Transcript_39282/g.69069  ORF Transcript_39282/g.69069 Transcript_39282/m.69069 type:complete len:692 (+) Transcript_39282:124-2199(+)